MNRDELIKSIQKNVIDYSIQNDISIELVEDSVSVNDHIDRLCSCLNNIGLYSMQTKMGRPIVVTKPIADFIRSKPDVASRKLSTMIWSEFKKKVSPNTVCNFRNREKEKGA